MAQLVSIPAQLDLVCYAGDDFFFTVTLTDENGDPLPITGTSKAQVRPDQESTTYWDMDVAVDPVITNQAVISIVGTKTTEMVDHCTHVTSLYVGTELVTAPMFTGVWDWQQDASGVKTYASGKFAAIAEVSR